MNQINQTNKIDRSPVSRVPLVSQSLTQQTYPLPVAHVAATSNPGRSEPQPELRTLNLDHFHAPSHESKSILMPDSIVCADGEPVLSVKDQ